MEVEDKLFKELFRTTKKKGLLWLENYMEYLNGNASVSIPDGLDRKQCFDVAVKVHAQYLMEINIAKQFK